MSGHSKWSTIKRKKGAADQKRGAQFSKLIKMITLAVREGGSDIDSNMRLRTLVDSAKAINMPQDTLKRAIQRGEGTLEGITLVEKNYEGYGPQGVAILIETYTDNTNRTTAEVRHILNKYGGSLGENGCVSWMFSKKGLIIVTGGKVDGDALMETAIENGAEDVQEDEGIYTITCAPEDFNALSRALDAAHFPIDEARISKEPQTTVVVDEKHVNQVLRIMTMLEEIDDVQNVYSNFDIPDEVMEKLDN